MQDAIQKDVRAWLLSQADWMQEAADRLLKNGSLSDDDFSELVALLKTPEGTKASNHRKFDELLQSAGPNHVLRLSSISDVVGIENLSPNSPLTFGDGNLTVMYGHNGSGKSSYTRILKKSSGKPRAVTLKSNVFHDAPAEQKCRISFKVNDQDDLHDWNASDPAIDALRSIDIFDSDEATNYLRNENSATYSPPIVAILQRLADACDRVKADLQTEQSLLISALPALPAHLSATEPARQYEALRHNLPQAQLDQLIGWTEENERSLTTLTERLKVDDPAAKARKQRATKTQAQQLSGILGNAAKAFGLVNINSIRTLKIAAQEKRKIAIEAAQVNSAELDGIGTATWKSLWEAARAYSQTPYPHQP